MVLKVRFLSSFSFLFFVSRPILPIGQKPELFKGNLPADQLA